MGKAKDDLGLFGNLYSIRNPKDKVSFINGYNPSHLAGLGDAVQVVSQAMGSSVNSYDLKTILMQIHSEVKTRKILLVGHSQGAFYTNELYGYLTEHGVPEESIAVYNLASPAGFVAGEGSYLTSANDGLVNNVREWTAAVGIQNPLPANILIPLARPELDELLRGHSFSEEYLAGAAKTIIADITESLNSLGLEDETVESEGCFDAPAEDFSYQMQHTVFAMVDPAAQITQEVAAAAGRALAAVGVAITQIIGGTGISAGDDASQQDSLGTDNDSSKTIFELVLPPVPNEVLIKLAAASTDDTGEDTTQQNSDDDALYDSDTLSVSEGESGSSDTSRTQGEESVEAPSEPRIDYGGGTPKIDYSSNTGDEQNVVGSEDEVGDDEGDEDSEGDAADEGEDDGSNDDSSEGDDGGDSSEGDEEEEEGSDEGSEDNDSESDDESDNEDNGNNEDEEEGDDENTEEDDNEENQEGFTVAYSEDTTQSATSTITFSGTGAPGDTIAQDFSDEVTTVDENGLWELTVTDLPDGETTIIFSELNDNEEVVDTVSISVSVETPLKGLSVAECAHSLRTDACLLGGAGSVSFSWDFDEGELYRVTLNGASVEETSATSSSVTLGVGEHTVEVSALDVEGSIATSSTQDIEVFEMPIVINEIAWAGTQASAADEWIELYNRTNYTLDLSHVVLYAEDLVPYLELAGPVASKSYYLIERGDSNTTSAAEDIVLAFSGQGSGSGLSNSGEVLYLAQAFGSIATTTLDRTPDLASCGGGWCGGDASSKTSMERKDVDVAGDDPSNWNSNNTYTVNDTDEAGGVMYCTPKSQNSISILTVGYYCPNETESYVAGQAYTPVSGTCTYLSENLSGNRYGDLYRGVVGSATIVNGHSLGTNPSSTQNNDSVADPVDGENMFAAMYEIHDNSDVANFRSFFQMGSNPPPHLWYGIVPWVYLVPAEESSGGESNDDDTDSDDESDPESSGGDSSTPPGGPGGPPSGPPGGPGGPGGPF
ncbi:MAG: hypothetical protein OQJ98_02720 [Candidatus Pacebacteria bacterium]|nr:hypothetical protein [Candidatus Paceibacterota bacterium]